MPPTGEEIRANLTRFVARWSVRDGYERGEAQTFLTELFACYGQRLSDDRVREEIGDIAKRLIECRQAICVENEVGLTKLYNQADEGAWSELNDLHRSLDETVARAYGWSAAVADDPLEAKARLAVLHGEVVEGAAYNPFG